VFGYRCKVRALESLGYTILSVTADGLPGLPAVFSHIPFQFCHFHAQKTVIKYTTKKPRTEAGRVLLQLMYALKEYSHETFLEALIAWHQVHQDFLKEKTVHPDGSWSYTHRKLRSALRSILNMSQYLFTYQAHPAGFIPPTTNTLEGHFSHIKIRAKCHRGITPLRLQRVVHALLLASSVSYREDLVQELF
jgi:hypothetical protein